MSLHVGFFAGKKGSEIVATTDAVLAAEVQGAGRSRLAPANAHLAAGVIDAEFSEVPTRHLRDYSACSTSTAGSPRPASG